MTDLGYKGVDLGTRQLSAFSRFGPLRYFDLKLARIDKIITGDPEPGGSHLLDRAFKAVAVG